MDRINYVNYIAKENGWVRVNFVQHGAGNHQRYGGQSSPHHRTT